MRTRLRGRHAVVAALAAALALSLVPTAGAEAQIYWWQRNMAPGQQAFSRTTAHNHTYNELYFGPNAGWRSEIWEITPAGYKHFDVSCVGNCYFSHPGYYYDYPYCTNRDWSTHFVTDCMDRW